MGAIIGKSIFQKCPVIHNQELSKIYYDHQLRGQIVKVYEQRLRASDSGPDLIQHGAKSKSMMWSDKSFLEIVDDQCQGGS